MKKTFNRISSNWLLVLLVFATVISCTKKENKEMNLPRQFKTGDITFAPEETRITLSWSHVFGTAENTYTVQVSKDSTFATGLIYDTVVNKPTVLLTDAKLLPRQIYYARVKANALGSSAESGWVNSARFAITGEQIFLPIAGTDIIDNGVLLKWKTTPGLTRIVITPQTGAPMTFNLTPADLTAEKKIISGLNANTTYSAEIFDATKSKGFVVFKTGVPLTGNIIDLRGISGRPNVLADTIPIIPAGSIVLLNRAETYTIASALNLGKTIVIRSGADLAATAQANIYFTSNFNFTAGATIDSIEFNDVHLYSDSYGSRYVFNTTNGATVGKIKFLNSRIEIFRGMTRLQSGTTSVTSYIVDNCVIDSLSNYGVITVDNVACKADNISITNSTIYKAEKVVTSRQNSVGVLIDACTFDEAPWGGGSNYIVDYSTAGTNNVTNGITINNCIFGIGKWNGGNTAVRDVRAAATTLVNSTNDWRTADHVSLGNDLPVVTTYSKTAVQLWQDPFNGNFKIIDASFPAKGTSGDPRWR
jgi:hypothetical protein